MSGVYRSVIISLINPATSDAERVRERRAIIKALQDENIRAYDAIADRNELIDMLRQDVDAASAPSAGEAA